MPMRGFLYEAYKDKGVEIMEKVSFDYGKAAGFISQEEVGYMEKLVEDARKVLVSKSGAGNDFLGWLDLPVEYDKEEFARIKKAAEKIQGDSEVLPGLCPSTA